MSVQQKFIQALKLCEEARFSEAVQLFTGVLNTEPAHLESIFNRGMAYTQLGEYQLARLDFEKALSISPLNPQIYSELGVIKHLLADHRGALADLDKALELEPGNPYRYSSRAYIRAHIGDVWGAIDDYKEALALDPDDAIVYNNLGLLEEKIGYQTSAQANFAQADQLADQGKTFVKPDLNEILANYEAEKALQSQTEILQQQADSLALKQQKFKPQDYLKVIQAVFTSRQTFGEFLDFVKGKWKKNNSDKA
ncbi:MAG: tetratricopeptide repeat protein [Microscillaceae bacterium]|jgi:Flp pilus assembly protein TadD|nr:tetratricopeptide repeat protein [Microscillaceae bacterium]